MREELLLKHVLISSFITLGSLACSSQDNMPSDACAECPQMQRVAPGSFQRSIDPNPWVRGDKEFGQTKTIVIEGPFEIGRYEVTNAEWRACLEAGGCTHKPDGFDRAAENLPVTDVNWLDVKGFIDWLNTITDGGYRLPSEAEWEFAARAGSSAKFTHGEDPAELCAYVNHRAGDSTAESRNPACSDGFPDELAPVGSLKASAYGTYDMLGNVWEWVTDCWHDADWEDRDVYDTTYVEDAPTNADAFIGDETQCKTRVMRGGSFSNGSLNSFSPHFRNFDYAERRYPNLGFRVARDLN